MMLDQHIEQIDCPEPLNLLKTMLQLAGIWPTKQITTALILKLLVCWTLLPGAIVCMLIELCKVGSDINKIIEVLVSLLQFIIVAVKLSSVTLKKKCFLSLLKQLHCMISSHKIQNEIPTQRATTISNKLVKFFGMLTISVVVFYTLFPVIDKKALPIPFSYELGRYYYLMHLTECLMLITAGLTGNSIDALYVTLATFAAAEIEILNSKLLICTLQVKEGAGNNKLCCRAFNELVKRNLLECIRLHTSIIR
ncbi:odorant receptor [Holotrichia oblita]|uniref:Odorant receptor n=2 Tax=Holotrichia oblita TaxID=644536 RepID=A0ACB9TNM8_HOLOL|nr:odorant receptor [Holotrichia oblita]KAI4468379.1 odorant receptor [Holotrichia oblita]